MKYILFLFCILFLNQLLWAEGEPVSSDGITVNLGNFQKDFAKPKPTFTRTLDDMNNFSVGSGLNPYSLTPPPDFSFGAASGGIRYGEPICSVQTPQACQLYTSCRSAGGYWDAIDGTCGPSTCHFGTTPEIFTPTRCRCNGETYAYVSAVTFYNSAQFSARLQKIKFIHFFRKVVLVPKVSHRLPTEPAMQIRLLPRLLSPIAGAN